MGLLHRAALVATLSVGLPDFALAQANTPRPGPIERKDSTPKPTPPETYQFGEFSVSASDNPKLHRLCTTIVEAGFQVVIKKNAFDLTHSESKVTLPLTTNLESCEQDFHSLQGALTDISEFVKVAVASELSFTRADEGALKPKLGDFTLRAIQLEEGDAARQVGQLLKIAKIHHLHRPFEIKVDDPSCGATAAIDAFCHSPKITDLLNQSGLSVHLTSTKDGLNTFQIKKVLPNCEGKLSPVEIGPPIIINREKPARIEIRDPRGDKSIVAGYFETRDYEIIKAIGAHVKSPPIVVKGSSFPIDVISTPDLYDLVKTRDLAIESIISPKDEFADTRVVTFIIKTADSKGSREYCSPVKVLHDLSDYVALKNKLLEFHIKERYALSTLFIPADPRINTPPPSFPFDPKTSLEILHLLQTARRVNYDFVFHGANAESYIFEVVCRGYNTGNSPIHEKYSGDVFTVPRALVRDPSTRNATLYSALHDALRRNSVFLQRTQIEQGICDALNKPDQILTLVSLSLALSQKDRNCGIEFRYGYELLTKVNSFGLKGESWEFEAIALPILHTLQSIHTKYPGYLKELADKKVLDTFTKGLTEFHLEEFRKHCEGVFIDSSCVIVGFAAFDEGFSNSDMEKLAEKCEIPSERRHFMKGTSAKVSGAVEQKTWLLEKLALAAAEKERKTFIPLIAHGMEDRAVETIQMGYLANGMQTQTRMFVTQPAVIGLNSGFGENDKLKVQEIAEALVTNCNNGKGEIDLSKIVIAFDSCYMSPENFKRTLSARIIELGQKQEREIRGLPEVFSAGSRGTVSYHMFEIEPKTKTLIARTALARGLLARVKSGVILRSDFAKWSSEEGKFSMIFANNWMGRDVKVPTSGTETKFEPGAYSIHPTVFSTKLITDSLLFESICPKYRIPKPVKVNPGLGAFEWSMKPLTAPRSVKVT